MLSLYPPVIDELERRFPAHELPSPVAEGVLDAPLWRNAASPRTTAPHWLARQSRSSLLVAAGQLDGARPGLAVLATARSADGQVRELRTHIETADLVSARISLPASLAAPDAGNWRVVPQEPPADAVLRVSGEVGAIAGLNLEFPASIAPVLEGAADLRIERRGHGFAVMTAAGAEIALDNQAALNRYLGSAATLKWLDQLVARAHGHRIDGFSVEVLSLAGDGQALRAQPVQGAMGDAPWLAAGEQAAVEVSNLSGRSVDLLIMGVDARGQVYPIYPPSSAETNRFESGRPARPSGKRFVLPAPLMRPGGRLLVLAAPARALSAPRLFGAAPVHEPADGLVRGQAAALPEGAVHAASLHW